MTLNDRRRALMSMRSGGTAVQYTPINCVTVLNGSSFGYRNRFDVSEVVMSNVKRIEASVKFDTSLTHCIWFASVSGEGIVSQPFADKSSGSQISVSVGSTDSDGFTVYQLSYSGSSGNHPSFGSWSDSTYSHNVAFKSIKGYDANGDVLFELVPCKIQSGMACMLNKTAGKFIFPSFYRNDLTAEGDLT